MNNKINKCRVAINSSDFKWRDYMNMGKHVGPLKLDDYTKLVIIIYSTCILMFSMIVLGGRL